MTGRVRGRLGDRSNPVCCYQPSGEQNYLGRLRNKSGKRPEFVRIGSVDIGPYGNLLDLYWLSGSGLNDREVYMDMYHPGYVELKPIPGYSIFNLGTGPLDLTPPSDFNDADIGAFYRRIKRAVKSDARMFQKTIGSGYSDAQCIDMMTYAIFLMAISRSDDRNYIVDSIVGKSGTGVDRATANRVYTFLEGE